MLALRNFGNVNNQLNTKVQSIADFMAQSSASEGNEDDLGGNGSIDNVDHGSFGDVLDDESDD